MAAEGKIHVIDQISQEMIEFFSEWMFIQTILQLFFLLFTPVLKAATFFIPLKETKQMRNQNQSKTQMAGKEPFKSIMSQLIRSEHCDSRGIAFAGQIMAWMDICAGVSAFRHSGVLVVTAAVDAVHLFNPVLRDNICIIRSSVNRAWKSSLEIGVTVETEDMLTGHFTFVSANKETLPELIPFTLRERRRYHEAQERRNLRLSKPKVDKIIACLPHHPEDIESGEEQDNTDSLRRKSYTSLVHRDLVNNQIMVNCSETYTEVFEIVFPEHCNSMGITFGGQIMKWMEYAAAMAANRFCRSDLMVVSIDALNFKHSTKLGDIVTVRAMVSANFLTSIEVYVTVEKETLNEGVLVTNDGWVTIVSTGEGSLVGKDKRPVHKAIAVSKLEVQRQQGAEERRIRRLKDAESIRSYSKISNPQDFAAKPLSK